MEAGCSLGTRSFFDGSFVFGEKLVERDFQGTGEFFQSFDGRNGAAIFQAREVAAKQAGAFLDIALREVLRLAQAFEPFADDHGRELTIICRADSIIVGGKMPRIENVGQASLPRRAPHWHIFDAYFAVSSEHARAWQICEK